MIEFDHVTRRFDAVTALDDTSFEVPTGSLCGFCGPNGAGKTTAMRVLAGVLPLDRGEVRWRGDPVDRELCRRFGYLPEERGLYPAMSVVDHLVYLARLRGMSRDRARRATDRVIETFGLRAVADRRVGTLSLGNSQRVQLASALVHDPALLVLDEPFNGLDPLAADQLASLLRERVNAGATVLMSSHQLDTVERVCDHVVIIDKGRCVHASPMAKLGEAGVERDMLAGGVVVGPARSLLDVFHDAVGRPCSA